MRRISSDVIVKEAYMEQLTATSAYLPQDGFLMDSGRPPVPEDCPPLGERAAFKRYFDEEGFIVVRNALPASLCEAAKQAFLAEVWPDKRHLFLRHASGAYERHVYTDAGFMKYPIMNIQDVSGQRYPRFRNLGLQLLTQDAIRRAMENLFGEPGQLIHSMYFDGNQVTWAHRDGHYIDSKTPGSMVGVWVAAEDIHPDAGRFYVLPRSHRMAVPGEHDDPNREAYKAAMAAFVRNGPLDCVSPILKQGDMLLWSSLTIHGSLPTLDGQRSRRSFTAHYIPRSHGFRWSGGNAANKPRAFVVNGVQVTSHIEPGLAGFAKQLLIDRLPALYSRLRRARLGAAGKTGA
jgi:phytanoyl-CoA hydroxylase